MLKIVETKLLEFFDIGSRVGKINLARKKFMLHFSIGIILSKDVNFPAIAEYFNPEVELKSHIRRMERFFDEYQLDYVQIAVILLCFLPAGRISISIDRTNWQFGNRDINFLAITAFCKGVGIPLFFELLDKKGNSNTTERQALLKKLFRVVPPKQVLAFTADREFVGEKWYKFLIKNKVPFYIRIKSNYRVSLCGVTFEAKRLAISTRKRVFENISMHGLKFHLATKLIGHQKDSEDRYLLILTNAAADKAIDIYRQRWSIEVFFQSVKKRGFNLENTHLTGLPKLKKLFAFVSLAFACCLKIGIWKHEHQKPMKKKKNGYKPNSFFRYGLNEIRRALLHFHITVKLALDMMDNLIRQLRDNHQLWSTLNFILKL